MSNPGPITRQRLERIHTIFKAASALPVRQRALLLDQMLAANPELRPEVVALLREHEGSDNFLDSRPVAGKATLVPEVIASQKFGAYRIVRELGRGGSATVYLGAPADDSVTGQAAIKVLTGADASAFDDRFHREWEITASLDHPNIARMLEPGVSNGGLCYLLMEYVDGVHINCYTAQNLLSTTETVRLFVEVCSAVSYAHQHSVIHRDIKPSNILVNREGVPKLIDFGISSFISRGERLTRTGDHRFTPDYAAPEQILGKPPTAQGDIYSLGVLLFHLLTGSHPHADGSEGIAALRAIADREAAKPSSLRGDLPKDLDAVILKALRNEPEHRYASVAEFQADLELYLSGTRVNARNGAWTYRVSKIWRKNRLVSILAAALVVTVAAGAFVTYHYASRASSGDEIIREFAGELSGDGDAAAVHTGGQRWMLKTSARAIAYLRGLHQDHPGDLEITRRLMKLLIERGELLGHPGRQSAGDTARAITDLQEAVTIAEAICTTHPTSIHCLLDGHRAHSSLGSLLIEENRYDEAAPNFQRAIDLNLKIPGDDPNYWTRWSAYADALANLSRIQLHQQNFVQCLETRRKAVDVWRRVAAARTDPMRPPIELASVLASRGWVEREMGRTQDALASYAEGEIILRAAAKVLPDEPNIKQLLARNLGETGRILAPTDRDRALRALDESLAIFRELRKLDPDSVTTERYMAITESRLAREREKIGDHASAHKLAQEGRQLIAHVVVTDTANVKAREEAEEIDLITAGIQL